MGPGNGECHTYEALFGRSSCSRKGASVQLLPAQRGRRMSRWYKSCSVAQPSMIQIDCVMRGWTVSVVWHGIGGGANQELAANRANVGRPRRSLSATSALAGAAKDRWPRAIKASASSNRASRSRRLFAFAERLSSLSWSGLHVVIVALGERSGGWHLEREIETLFSPWPCGLAGEVGVGAEGLLSGRGAV